MAAKHNATGRSRRGKSRSFASIDRRIMTCHAFRSLTPLAQAAYTWFAFSFNGANNGRIIMSSQMMANHLNVSKATGARAIAELIEKGFVVVATPGAFNMKHRHASEYRLTAIRCNVTGELPTNEFERWKPEI